MTKTMSIRMDEEHDEFLNELSKQEKGDLSKTVRELMYRGRVMLAVERYKKGQAALGQAAGLAGVPIGQMITILEEYGIRSNLEKEDYLKGLENLRKVWYESAAPHATSPTPVLSFRFSLAGCRGTRSASELMACRCSHKPRICGAGVKRPLRMMRGSGRITRGFIG